MFSSLFQLYVLVDLGVHSVFRLVVAEGDCDMWNGRVLVGCICKACIFQVQKKKSTNSGLVWKAFVMVCGTNENSTVITQLPNSGLYVRIITDPNLFQSFLNISDTTTPLFLVFWKNSKKLWTLLGSEECVLSHFRKTLNFRRNPTFSFL